MILSRFARIRCSDLRRRAAPAFATCDGGENVPLTPAGRATPTLAEFVQSCRAEFRFLVTDFGFREAPCSVQQERFCVRFAKEDRSLQIRGEGYGTTAACHLSCGDRGPLALIYLVPDASRPKRSRKRDGMGQLDHIHEYAALAREHAKDFCSGDVSRFAAIWDTRHGMRSRE